MSKRKRLNNHGFLSGVAFTEEQRCALQHFIRNKCLPARTRLRKDMAVLPDDHAIVKKGTVVEIERMLGSLEEFCFELNNVEGGLEEDMMKVRCKKGVWFKFICAEFLQLAQIFCDVYSEEGLEPTVTSAADGNHGKISLHPEGFAWDWRIWGLKNVEAVVDKIRKRARAISFRYDIVFGDPRHRDHIHSEFDIRKPEE